MANVHTIYDPKHEGEKQVARVLRSMDDDRLHLWFSVNYIPGVNDVDVVLWHEDVGAFVIEVKSYSLNNIHEYGLESWVVADLAKTRSPQSQALEAMWALRNYVKPKMGFIELPYTVPTVCFPKIKRANWRLRWRDCNEVVKLSESFLMEDDISGGAQMLVNRLSKILQAPPAGLPPRPPFTVPTRESLDAFISSLDVSARPKPTATDLERLRALEAEVSRETQKRFKPFGDASAIYYGHPGTGKTFRLLQIGLFHAKNGASVLFACFNKVLAADLRRLLHLLKADSNVFQRQEAISFRRSKSEDDVANDLQAVDVFQLALQVCSEHTGLLDAPPSGASGSFDKWGRQLIADIVENRELFAIKRFDTVLVDEAQDLKDWQFDLLKLHCAERSTLVVAVGAGQELYDENPESTKWVESLKKQGARQSTLRRNFRNPKIVFQLAYMFSQCASDSSKIATALRRFDSAHDGHPLVEFDRMSFALPRIEGINEVALSNPEFSEHEDEISDQCLGIIEGELENLRDNQEPIDLLVLVPDSTSVVHDHVRLALDKMQKRKIVGYIDYTEDKFRRFIAPNEKIRFCTFHSSRGLEAARVVVFGIERIKKIGEDLNFDFKKLGFIVLSRSIFDCLIVRRSYDQEITPFLEKCVALLRQGA